MADPILGSKESYMTKLGATLIILGGGSFVLPLFGLQFRLLSLFGKATPVIGIVLAVAGVILIIIDRAKEQARVKRMAEGADAADAE
jgi:uncharacterized membrane protein YgdD (TMEM256/DUF423 family)